MNLKSLDHEVKRLEILWRQKAELVEAASKEVTEGQQSISKDAAGQFEKLAVFCGGTIALVITFLASHKDIPNWHILVPISIWVLAGGMIAATTRNLVHQHWAHRIFERSLRFAQREEQQARAHYLSLATNPISLQTGQPLDQQFLKNVAKSNKEVDEVLRAWESSENVLLNVWIYAGYVAQALALIGILCLVVLATRNV